MAFLNVISLLHLLSLCSFYGDLSLSPHVCRGEREKGQRRGVGRKRGRLVSSAVSELEARVSSFFLLAVYHYTNT